MVCNSWQLLFLALGTITAGMVFWLVFLLPDSPKKIIFLIKKEKAIVIQHTVANKTGMIDNDAFKIGQAWLALRDPQTWFLVLYQFCVNLWNGSVTSFSSIIINSFGFSHLKSLLMQMPMGGAQVVFLVLSAAIQPGFPELALLP